MLQLNTGMQRENRSGPSHIAGLRFVACCVIVDVMMFHGQGARESAADWNFASSAWLAMTPNTHTHNPNSNKLTVKYTQQKLPIQAESACITDRMTTSVARMELCKMTPHILSAFGVLFRLLNSHSFLLLLVRHLLLLAWHLFLITL